MGRFLSRVAFCVATELVAYVIADKIWSSVKGCETEAKIIQIETE